MKSMNIKTTQEIKKQNDYKYKTWVNTIDVITALQELINKIDKKSKEKEENHELQDNTPEKRESQEILSLERILQELRNLRNLKQSNEHIKKKIDSIEAREYKNTDLLNKNVTDLFDYFSQLNDRLTALEAGKKEETKNGEHPD